jgi:hypothetical protein
VGMKGALWGYSARLGLWHRAGEQFGPSSTSLTWARDGMTSHFMNWTVTRLPLPYHKPRTSRIRRRVSLGRTSTRLLHWLGWHDFYYIYLRKFTKNQPIQITPHLRL